MQTQRDNKGHIYARVGNIRVTYIPAEDREPDKDWSGSDVIRVNAYKDSTSNSIFQGAEFPVATPTDFADFVAAICQVYAEGRLGRITI